LDSDKSTPLTPEGARGAQVSPDGHWFVFAHSHGTSLAPVEGGPHRTLTQLQKGEAVLRWSADGRELFLQKREGDAVKISRFDVSTGRKEPWQTLRVPEPGAEFIGAFALSADGKACAFSFQHDLANLYLVNGLK
jgi:Tol biopolymer transport system component